MTQYPVDLHSHPEIKSSFDPQTNTISYVVTDQNSTSCAVIDSVMDIDYAAGRITYEHADKIKRTRSTPTLSPELADGRSEAPPIDEGVAASIGGFQSWK